MDLIAKVKYNRRRLDRKIQHLSAEALSKPGTVGEGSFKDMLAHLAVWQERFLSWLESEKRGQSIELPDPSFTFSDKKLAEANRQIYEAHRDLSPE
jgi:hypothetical protein